MARFRKYGRSRQLLVASAKDLRDALDLDPARWAATGAPLSAMMIDPVLLHHLDTEGDGRLLAHELRQAMSWTLGVFSDYGGIDDGQGAISPAQISSSVPDGSHLINALALMLDRLGKGPQEALDLDELREYSGQLAQQPVNVAGVILPEAAVDETVRTFVDDAIRVTGGTPHPSGSIGLRVDQGEEFVEGITPYLGWVEAKPVPFGDTTAEVAQLIEELAPKIDRYFLLTKVSKMDPRLTESLNLEDSTDPFSVLDDAQKLDQLLARYPVAPLRADDRLELAAVDNPMYADSIGRLFSRGVAAKWPDSPAVLTREMWTELTETITPYSDWLASRPLLVYDDIERDRLLRYRSGREASALAGLAAEAVAQEVDLETVALLEKAILFQKYILRVANNFVSFPELYTSSSRALFEAGSLVMDGRYFHLAVRVADRAAHKKIAAMSNMFVLYVLIRDVQDSPSYEVAVPVTYGSIGNLGVGKRGVFLDTENRELDAEVVDTIQNPISLGEAIRAPFSRLGGAITTRIESLGTNTEKQVAGGSATGLFGTGGTAGLLAGGGIAVAALGSAAAFITGTLAKLAWWKILVALGAIAGLIVLPAMIAAILKLRRRDISSVIEASGWAVNSRMRLTRKLSRFFTQDPGPHYRLPAIIASSAGVNEGVPGPAADPGTRPREPRDGTGIEGTRAGS